MHSVDWAKFDEACRREFDVPASAWIRAVGPSLIEMRIGEGLNPLASVTDEGAQHLVRTPDGVSFVGSAEHARRLMWQVAATAPQPPAAPARSRKRSA